MSALAVVTSAEAQNLQNYSPTAPLKPSAGYINDYLRKDNPYASAWDVGTQVRLRYEVRDNFFLVPNNDFRANGVDTDNSYLLHRIRPRIGYTTEWVSFMVEGRSSGSTGDDRHPNPESDGPIDLHQAYVVLGNHKEFPLSLKIGRQEMIYGDERLIGAFGWNNIGRVFDAAKLRWQNPWFAADFFTSRVVIPDDNNFNLSNDYDQFSGIYGSTKKIPKTTTEFYFLSRNVGAGSPTFSGAGSPALLNGPPPRDIYTVGMRFKSNPGELGNWDYTAELMGQFGHFNDPAIPAGRDRSLEHQAYAVFAGGGYTFVDASYTPRVGLEYNYASGDSDPLDDKHETFENLFPTNHKFYGYMDLFSLQNIHNVRFVSSIKPLPRLTLLGEAHAFWMADTSDSLYTAPGTRRGGIGSTAGTGYGINSGHGSYVGSEIDFIATYNISPQTALEAGYAHFFRGDYIKDTWSNPAFGSKDADWFYVQLTVNF